MPQRKTSANVLDDATFVRLSEFVTRHSGIVVGEKKRTMLEFRLQRRMRETGITSVGAYCKLILEGQDLRAEAEIDRFIDEMTVNKTDFFREGEHFERLKTTILPSLTEKTARTLVKGWSVACANGAETYSMAMVMDEYAHKHPGLDYFVLGTDISLTMVETASFGCYSQAATASIPPALLRRHLLKARDETRRELRIAPHLRQKTAFARLNLIDERYPIAADYDIVFCRNVLIYFDKPTQKRVLSHIIEHMRSGGFLILGHSESTTGMHLPMIQIANTVLRKQ